MQSLLTRSVVVIAMTVAMCGCQTALPLSATADVCGLRQHHDRHLGERIVLDGVFFTDWRHVTGLMDERCADVIVAFEPGSPASPSLNAAWDDMLAKRGRPSRALMVTVSATVIFDDGARNLMLRDVVVLRREEIATPAALGWAASSW